MRHANVSRSVSSSASTSIPLSPWVTACDAPDRTRVTTGTHPHRMASSIARLNPSAFDASTKMSLAAYHSPTASGATPGRTSIDGPPANASLAGPSPTSVSRCANPCSSSTRLIAANAPTRLIVSSSRPA